MDQGTQHRGQQELQAIIGGIFDYVLRKDKENAILSACRMERPTEKSDAGHTKPCACFQCL